MIVTWHIIVTITMVALLAVLAGWQPKWLPSQLRGPLIGLFLAIGVVASLIPIISPTTEVPTLVIFIFVAIIGLILLAWRLLPRAYASFVDRSSQLREAVRTCFDILLHYDELDVTDLKVRAEALANTRFHDKVWERTLKILEQQGALEIRNKEV